MLHDFNLIFVLYCTFVTNIQVYLKKKKQNSRFLARPIRICNTFAR